MARCYSLQGNAKREGRQHVDRDAQFRYIRATPQRQQQPTISPDTKKKELVGAFRTRAAPGARSEDAEAAGQVHDFVIPATATTGGKAIPRYLP